LKHSDPLAAVRTWQHVLGHNSKRCTVRMRNGC
jgi:hypothetical protein